MKAIIVWLSVAILPVSARAPAPEIGFKSPSGNIHCLIPADAPVEVRCDLIDSTVTLPRPADCDLDWGRAFALARTGRASPVCAGDTIIGPHMPVLGYGRSVGRDGLRCTSSRSGMSCRNAEGHGFMISRQRQRLY